MAPQDPVIGLNRRGEILTRCRYKDKNHLANWVGGGHLPNQGGQSGGIEGGGGGPVAKVDRFSYFSKSSKMLTVI